jgi:hypothetical protein
MWQTVSGAPHNRRLHRDSRRDGKFLKEDSALKNETKTVKPTLSRYEAADYLGIHVNTLDKSEIPRFRIGRRTLFRLVTLDMFVEEMERISRGPKCGK